MQFKGALNSVPENIRINYGFELLSERAKDGFWLDYKDDELFIQFSQNWNDLRLDFVQVLKDLRTGKGKPSTNLLKQTLGKKRKLIIDATCGLGNDSLLMIFFGHKVTAFERNPVVAALLENAWQRATTDPDIGSVFSDNLSINYGSATDFLANSDVKGHWIYYDPMFVSHAGKKSLSSKGMQFLDMCSGEDGDFLQVLDLLICSAALGVILKRPDKSPELSMRPDEIIKGKTVQFEKYTCKPRAF